MGPEPKGLEQGRKGSRQKGAGLGSEKERRDSQGQHRLLHGLQSHPVSATAGYVTYGKLLKLSVP